MAELTLFQRAEIQDAYYAGLRAALDARDINCFAHALGVATDLAYRMGVEAAHQGEEIAYDWATRWTFPDGTTEESSANSAGKGAEALARKRATQRMTGAVSAEAIRRIRRTGDWEVAPDA